MLLGLVSNLAVVVDDIRKEETSGRSIIDTMHSFFHLVSITRGSKWSLVFPRILRLQQYRLRLYGLWALS